MYFINIKNLLRVAIATILVQILTMRCSGVMADTLPPGTVLAEVSTFEYIVVGGGAAGCAAAALLAAAGCHVLLLEAGGDPSPLSKIPSASMALLGSSYDWQYKTQPNNISCLSSQGQQCRFSRGKCLGGSTSINYMLYTRGNRRDYDDYHISGWAWADLEPYFLRSEGLQILDQFPESSRPYHNTTGPVKLEFFNDPENPWQRRIIDGFECLGVPFNVDVNGESQIGVTRNTGFVYQGERMSTDRAYLNDYTAFKNKLIVAKNSYCTRVIIDSKKVAIGVTVVQESITKRIYATKQIILSAGAVETPGILLRSGIGPTDHLRNMGIPVIADLPIGENMSDHVLPLVISVINSGTGVVQDITKPIKLGVDAAEYITTNKGPLGSNGLVDTNVFLNTSCYNYKTRRLESGPGCDLPTMQLISAYIDKGLVTLGKPFVKNAINLNDNIIDQLATVNTDSAIIVFSPIVLKPDSRGFIRLASSRLLDLAIHPNYLSEKSDVDEMMRSISILEDLMETPAFKSQNAKLFHFKLPGCPTYEDDRDEYWLCHIRHMTSAVFHTVGTCSLQTCVDTELRVMGVKRLRVADASIFPEVMRGNTASPTIAVGVRVADFVLGEKYD